MSRHELNRPHAARINLVLDEVAAESVGWRASQDAGLIYSKHADPDMERDRRIRWLVEELGRVAQAISSDKVSSAGGAACDRASTNALRDRRAELIQLTAIVVAIAESISPHQPDCDVNDSNPDGITKPCNCGGVS